MTSMRESRLGRQVVIAAAGMGLLWTMGAATSSLAASAAAGPIVRDGHVCTVVGTSGPDNLVGHAGDVVCGLGGNDKLTAVGSGSVILIGGDGSDSLVGSSDPAAHDVLNGDMGRDHLVAHGGTNELHGGKGADVLDGAAGTDVLTGGPGNDTLIAGTGDDMLNGGPGDDHLLGGSGSDSLNGGAGNDVLEAGDGSTSIDGGSGDDSIDCGTSGAPVSISHDGSDSENEDCTTGNVTVASQEWRGTVTAFDPLNPGTVSVSITHEDEGAAAWRAAQSPSCDLTNLVFDLTTGSPTISVDDASTIAVGDRIELTADVGATNCEPVALSVDAKPAH